MSYAEKAIRFMLRNEDYAWDKGKARLEDLNDGAGWTFIGLTARDDTKFLPEDAPTIPKLAELYKTNMSRAIQIIIDVYTKHYWNPLYDNLVNARLAIRLFDLGVNMGVGTAVNLLERSLVTLGAKNFTPDTKFDNVTVDLCNKYSLDDAMPDLIDKHTDLFLKIGAKLQEITLDAVSFNAPELASDLLDLKNMYTELLGESVDNDVIDQYIKDAKARYNAIAQKPKFAKFLKGWMNRANRSELDCN